MAKHNKAAKTIDWHSHPLTSETVIDPSFKMTQNVRRFFSSSLGDEVKFQRDFLLWMKANAGLTLGQAVEEFKQRQA